MRKEILYRIRLPDDLILPSAVILIPFTRMFGKLDCEKKSVIPPGIGEICFYRKTAVIYDTFSGQKIFFIASLLFSSGVERIFFYGTAGDLKGKFEVGELLLPDSVASTFSFMEYERLKKIKYFLPKDITKYRNLRRGNVLTVFSPLEENKQFIKNSVEKGFELVEMELFPLIVAAKVYSKIVLPFIIVSDKFENEKWTPYFADKNFLKAKFTFFQELVEYAEEFV